jgi:hypothetical protein
MLQLFFYRVPLGQKTLKIPRSSHIDEENFKVILENFTQDTRKLKSKIQLA